jgi:multidrug efflux pump subunit AcrA (membrane-fusion protein)
MVKIMRKGIFKRIDITSDKKRFFMVGIFIGIAILTLAILLKSSPKVQANFDKSRLVSVMPLMLADSAPTIIAFGRVEPKNSWKAIAEVNGKVIYRHPDLESGRLLKGETLVLAIDPLEYQLKQAQALANVNSTQAQLKSLQQEQKNLNASLAIEQEKLKLIDQEYQRKLALKKKALISNSDLEAQKQVLLAQQKSVQDLSSNLALIPDNQKVTEAQLNVNQALLADVERQLENTRVVLPFDARIADVNIEQSQVVSIGSTLFEVDKLGAVEVKAELALQDAKSLMETLYSFPTASALPDIENLGFHAEVELQVGKDRYQWPAKLTRISGDISPDQATIGFYLEVEQPLRTDNNLHKPALTKGMFVSTKITGLTSQQFVIPEKALHGESIYIMDENKKLNIKKVTVNYRNTTGVAIEGDIQEGELLILNDLIPAIPGMSLKAEEVEEQNKHTFKKEGANL